MGVVLGTLTAIVRAMFRDGVADVDGASSISIGVGSMGKAGAEVPADGSMVGDEKGWSRLHSKQLMEDAPQPPMEKRDNELQRRNSAGR
jgi:hypothetical protein